MYDFIANLQFEYVVVRGPDEEQLVRLVARIDHLLATHQAA